MTNFLGYVGIAVISVIIAAFAIYRKRDIFKVSTLIVFYFFAAAITWIGEFIVLGIFDAYAYKTGLLSDPWAQNLIGHLLLNTTMFPAAAVLMVACSFKYRWIFSAAVVFIIIEYLFLKLGLYEQHWWRYYMSVVNFFAFILISKHWLFRMNQKRFGLTRAVTFFFVAIIFVHTPSPILLLFGKQHYYLALINNLVKDMYRSSIIFSFIYHLIFSFILVLFVCALKKWYWRLLPLIIYPLVEAIYMKFNILSIDDRWSVFYSIIISEVCIGAFILLEKYTLKPKTVYNE